MNNTTIVQEVELFEFPELPVWKITFTHSSKYYSFVELRQQLLYFVNEVLPDTRWTYSGYPQTNF